MSEQAIIKIQAVWRGHRARKWTLLRCHYCDSLAVTNDHDAYIELRKDSYLYLPFSYNTEIHECASCTFQDTVDLHKGKHFCGDWMCPGDCGVLWCGCIDVCRQNCNGSDWGTRW